MSRTAQPVEAMPAVVAETTLRGGRFTGVPDLRVCPDPVVARFNGGHDA
jgi:hypothetical protein